VSAIQEEVVRRVTSIWSDDMSTEETWSATRDEVVAGAEVVIGEDCRQQPGWCKESAANLQPLISLWNRWFHSQCHWDRQVYVAMRRTIASALREQRMIGSSGKCNKWKIRSCEVWVL